MRTASAALLPLLRSEVQGEVLALLLLHPDESFAVVTVANTIGRPVQGVQKEVSRLVNAGILTDRRVGNMRYVEANRETALYEPLTSLMAATYGPEPVLRKLLTDIEGVHEAYIYGSWAARKSGEPGPVPNDIDVIVVGSIPLDRLDAIADTAEHTLHRQVHIRRVSPEAWNTPPTGFLTEVRSRPLITLTAVA